MKAIFTVLGVVFLGLGLVGIYTPILPTTPFLLLAAFCFQKSSDKLNNWFRSTNTYQVYIKPIKNKKGLPLSKKIRILALVTLLVIISFFIMKNKIGRSVLIVILIFHYIYFLFVLKTTDE
ncbi:MAG: YbaN family protein [Anaerococcus sp.]|nr:YbaN family protein [Anaerococcus sp.]MDD7043819.1 YbaN family protein [Peptoniphilaceae bacterium]MDY2919560.1 YbaN family protein [Anaerococcus sp.]